MTNCPCECDGKSNKLEQLHNTRVFIAAGNGSVEILELVALFLLKTVQSLKIWHRQDSNSLPLNFL